MARGHDGGPDEMGEYGAARAIYPAILQKWYVFVKYNFTKQAYFCKVDFRSLGLRILLIIDFRLLISEGGLRIC
jgi:hypothetical protein